MRERIMREGVYEGSEFHQRLVTSNRHGKITHVAEELEFVNNDRSVGKYKSNIEAFMDVVYKTPPGERVYLMSPFVFLTPKAKLAFADAKRRGVEVIILTNGPQASAVPYKADAFNFWSKPQLNRLGVKVLFYNGDRRMHSKYAVNSVGDVYIGSHILNPNSEYLNSEAGVRIKSESVGRMMMDFSEGIAAESIVMGRTGVLDFLPCATAAMVSRGIVNGLRSIPRQIGLGQGSASGPSN